MFLCHPPQKNKLSPILPQNSNLLSPRTHKKRTPSLILFTRKLNRRATAKTLITAPLRLFRRFLYRQTIFSLITYYIRATASEHVWLSYQGENDQRVSNHRKHENDRVEWYLNFARFVPLRHVVSRCCCCGGGVLFEGDVEDGCGVVPV